MGVDKSFLRWGKESLLDHALRLAASVTQDVRIVGEANKFVNCAQPVIEDVYRQRGPLGGIHAALRNTPSDLNLMLAVDMPLIKPEFLGYLSALARETKATVIVPSVGEGFQPLCAIYRRIFGDVAERSLRAGKNKIDALFAKTITRIVTEEELVAAGFSSEMFRNLNTPEDFQSVRSSCDLGLSP